MVGAILTQSASWRNVESAIATLKQVNALSANVIRNLPSEQLAKYIHSSGYYNAKAKKLKALAEWLGSYGDSTEQAFAGDTTVKRRELLGIYGIGPETADSILLYAAGKVVFVIDAYTQRISERLGLSVPNASYESCQSLFTAALDANVYVFNEYHALLVRLGKDTCRKNNPTCVQCCLNSFCSYASKNQKSDRRALNPRSAVADISVKKQPVKQ
jgi:endonuclease-3 related protein